MMTILGRGPFIFMLLRLICPQIYFPLTLGVWDIVCGIHSHFEGVTELDIYVTLL